jgi:hypothetical protein
MSAALFCKVFSFLFHYSTNSCHFHCNELEYLSFQVSNLVCTALNLSACSSNQNISLGRKPRCSQGLTGLFPSFKKHRSTQFLFSVWKLLHHIFVWFYGCFQSDSRSGTCYSKMARSINPMLLDNYEELVKTFR